MIAKLQHKNYGHVRAHAAPHELMQMGTFSKYESLCDGTYVRPVKFLAKDDVRLERRRYRTHDGDAFQYELVP